MKVKIENIVIVLMCLMYVLSSCTDTIVPNNPPPVDGEKIPIAFDLQGLIDAGAQTRALVYPGDSVQGSGIENVVTDVTAYIFDQFYQCEEILQELLPPIPGRVGPVMVSVGTKHIVVVLNGMDKMTLVTNTTGAPYPPGVSYNGLLEMLTDNPGTPTSPPNPFLMTGLKNDVSLPTQVPVTSPHIIPVEVKRAIAKVKFSIGKSAKAAGRTIRLTDITMYQGARRVGLLRAPSPNPTLYDVTQTANVPSGFLVPDLSGSPGSYTGYAAVPDSLYTYESLCNRDTTKAIRVEVKWDMSGTIRTANFFLALDKSFGDSVYNVKRNTWYDVKMNIVDPGADSVFVEVVASPWNVADTITPPPIGAGGEFKTALPFKLVKNLMYNEMTWPKGGGTSSWGAIDNHSKGASWIDFRVTEDTPWEFDVRDNTARNQDVYWSLDSVNWTPFSTSTASGSGNDDWHRIYIYRPYKENNEPPYGPSLKVALDGIHKQDFIIEPRDTVPIPVNCYILRPQLTGAPVNETRAYIPLAGVFSHWENEILDGPDLYNYSPITATVLWQDRPFSQEVVKGVRVINGHNPDSAYIYCEAGLPGNAVIAMHLPTGDPNIYWTFHIWVTEYNPYEAAGQKLYETNELHGTNGDPNIKNVFMDRNLGAMSNSWDNDGNARGLLYQYGRKDPFPRGNGWSDSPLNYYVASYVIPTPISPSTLYLKDILGLTVWPDFRPKEILQYALNYPYEYFSRSTGGNWPLSLDSLYLWNSRYGNKTAYDPCPAGWRIPEMQYLSSDYFPWEGVLLTNTANGFNSVANGRYSPFVGFYPYSGYIHALGDLRDSGDEGRFWTSHSVSTNINMAVGLRINSSAPAMETSLDKAWGVSVRCVVDKNYILNVENGGLFGTGITNLKEELFSP